MTLVHFDNIYVKDITMFIPILASFVNILLITPLYCSIIWYERFGTDQRRTLINQLVAITCWHSVIYNVTCTPLEIVLNWFGPFGNVFCSVQTVLKNAGLFYEAAMIIAITLVKFLSIFVLKNPLGIHCEFWCLFINLVSTFGPLLSEIVFIILPGKLPMSFYICRGTYPTSLDQHQPKRDFPLFGAIALSFLFYLFVIVRVKVFKKKTISPISEQDPRNCPATLPPLNPTSDSHALASFDTIGQSLLTFFFISVFFVIINRIPPEKLAEFPNYLLVHFLHHGINLLWNIFAIIIFFSKSKTMRVAVFREFLDHTKRLKDWMW
jgi:hypothetical protein